MNMDFVIPVDSAIQDFRKHLLCHPRTILSARYGDGKSYFLDAFSNDSNIRKEFTVLKIYPVNYQVLENRDIFDIIKYDILLQMGLNDMLDPAQKISSRDAFLFCLKSNGLDFLESLFSVAGSMEGISPVKAIGKVGKEAIGVIRSIQKVVEDYKEYKKGELTLIDKYVDEMDNASIYEEDPITKIIQNNITAWRKKRGNKNKRVVLLFEDLDRIDPAHLFRILNIFSAHMDFSFKYAVQPNDSLKGNKFGVDNVVLVIHYENLRSIFHHFYGKDTCFEGYIHKFADKGKFVYSINEYSLKYYYQYLTKLTNLPEDVIKVILPEDRIRPYTIRELWNSVDNVFNQREEIDYVTNDIAGMMVCLRRLGFNDNEMVDSFRRAIEQDESTWMRYLYPYLKYCGFVTDSFVQTVNQEGRKRGFFFKEQETGIEVISTGYNAQYQCVKIGAIIRQVLNLVIR